MVFEHSQILGRSTKLVLSGGTSVDMPPPKLASKTAKRDQQSAFVRGCAEKLKKIEIRLDDGCSDQWYEDLDALEDPAGVARALQPLQQAAQLCSDSWEMEALTQCSPSANGPDDAAGELSRRLTLRIDEIDRAVPPMRSFDDMLGEVVLKHFDGHGYFMGTIMEYDPHTGFRLQYDDGDTEDVSLRDLRALMPPPWCREVRGFGVAALIPQQPHSFGTEPAARSRGLGSHEPAAPGWRRKTGASDSEGGGAPALRRGDSTKSRGAASRSERAEGKRPERRDNRGPTRPAKPAVGHAAAPTHSAAGSFIASSSGVGKAGVQAGVQGAANPALPLDTSESFSQKPSGKRSLEAAMDDEGDAALAQLPEGWSCEPAGRARSFVAPDGLTRFSTLAKAQRYASISRVPYDLGDIYV
jgi:hypothetical protein